MVNGADEERTDLSVQVQADPEAVARAAADQIAARVRARPTLTVLVATGNTPVATYAELARRVSAGRLDLSQVTAIQLDEYAGLSEADPRSLWAWMNRVFLAPLKITRTLRFDTQGEPEQACRAYDTALTAIGGIDLAILGLGLNGHLGFNEPPSPADAPTRAITLSPDSLQSNRAYWNADVPARALTAGMGVILAARSTLLLVTGEGKQHAFRRLLSGPAGPDFPASLLAGPGVTVLADRAAAGADITLDVAAASAGTEQP